MAPLQRSACYALHLVATLVLAFQAQGAAPHSLQDLWLEALQSSKADTCSSGLALWQRWISQAQALGIRSPEAHFNLATCERQQNHPAPAAYHYLTSATYPSSPLHLWRSFERLHELQEHLGVSGPVTESFFFQASLIFQDPINLFTGSLALWGTLLFLYLWRTSLAPHRLGPKKRVLILASLTSGLLALGGHSVTRLKGKWGVLDSGTVETTIYDASTPTDPKEVTSLPSGTVVQVGSLGNRLARITDPLLGLVKIEEVIILSSKAEEGQFRGAITTKPN